MNGIIYPGTFDPITNGHIDLVERAIKIFGKVVVAVAANSSGKAALFTLAERVALVEQALIHCPQVEVTIFQGLLIEFSRTRGIKTVLRGLRAISDFEYELQLANINRVLNPDLETVFLTPSEQYAYLSSSLIREIAALHGDISRFVPKCAEIALHQKLMV